MSIFFEWTESISVGNEVIDNQHKKLLAQVNKIINAMAFGTDSKELKGIINFFDDYIKEHFSYEEEYMKKIGFPNIEEHKQKHFDFIEKYNKFKNDFEQNVEKEKLIMEMEKYIGEWWIEHIGKEDKKYQLFLENGIF